MIAFEINPLGHSTQIRMKFTVEEPSCGDSWEFTLLADLKLTNFHVATLGKLMLEFNQESKENCSLRQQVQVGNQVLKLRFELF